MELFCFKGVPVHLAFHVVRHCVSLLIKTRKDVSGVQVYLRIKWV